MFCHSALRQGTVSHANLVPGLHLGCLTDKSSPGVLQLEEVDALAPLILAMLKGRCG